MMETRLLRIVVAAIALFPAVARTGSPDLAASFQHPPESAKPWVYWFWLDGNLTRDGITADLEAMRRVGIGGVIIMEVDAFIPKGPVRFLSPQWREMFRHVLTEASRLGIKIAMNNDAGWMGSGGPWIPPELAMQMTVWSETRVSGARRFSGALPQPKTDEGFYRDIAVLAFPTPPAEAARMADAQPVITWGASRRPVDAAMLTDGNAATLVELPELELGKSHTLNIDFPKPYSAQALSLALDRLQAHAKGTLAVSQDGRDFRLVRRFDTKWPIATVNFDRVSSRHFRITLEPDGYVAATLLLGELELLGGARIEGIGAKAAYVSEAFLPASAGGNLSAGMAIARKDVRVLSEKMDSAGRLTWDAPAGEWTVLRIGHTVTGKKNHPAPKEGLGLECDKLSTAAVDAHFAGLMEKLIADQKATGANALRYVHIDSWEAGSQNWTPRMREEWRIRRGYDLLPYLPVLTGRVVESPEISERFLWDLRRTVADMVIDNYAGRFRELSHRHGLLLSMEGYGAGPLDDLPYAGRADLPMTEFWMGYDPWWAVKEATSGAHTYGQNILAAEAFTSRSAAGKWQNHPFRMKPLGDQMFTLGVNQFVFHRYAMQPWLNRWPGMTMGPYGIEFDRTITWWEQSRAYLDYLSRCQFLLQQGRFAGDVAYLDSERVPDDFHEPSTLTPETPPGYDYDVVSAELLALMKIQDGALTLPSGMRYRVLILPAANTMRVSQLRKVKELVEAGAIVYGPPPSKSPSLAEYGDGDAEVRRIAKELWGESDGVNLIENRVGKGKVAWGKPIANVLSEEGVSPDFTCLGVDVGKQIRYIHRTAAGRDLYFLASAESDAATFLCTFRVAGKRPALWWPDSGRIEPVAAYDRQASQTRIPIRLDPYGSVFVVFESDDQPASEPLVAIRRNGVEKSGMLATSVSDLRGKMQGFHVEPNGAAQYQLETMEPGGYEVQTASGKRLRATVASVPKALEIDGPWELTFPGGWGAPERVTLDRLVSWTDYPHEGVKHFSGTGTYRRVVSIPQTMIGPERALYLDLGRVAVIAELRLNGHDLGILWKPPFRVDVSGVAKAGDNDLEVRVVNLWPNRLIGDEKLPADAEWNGNRLLGGWPQWFADGKPSPAGRVTFTTWRHWRGEDSLFESGLLGPVRIEVSTKVRLE